MSDPLLYVMLAFGVYRATRLVVVDYLLEPWRSRLQRSARKTSKKLAYLVTCPFCVGGWLSAAAVLAVWAVRPLPLPVLWWPAVAGAQSLLSASDAALTSASH